MPNDVSDGIEELEEEEWTLDELWNEKFDPLEWVIEGVLPKGTTLLVAAPKVGKSFWIACLIVAMLWETPAFGNPKAKVKAGDVLFITPDDPSKRRLQQRLKDIARLLRLRIEDREHQVFIRPEWPTIEDGGAEKLRTWLANHPEVTTVFIDTLEKLRDGPSGNGPGAMKADENAMKKLKAVGDDLGVTIIATHHDRKNHDSADIMDEVSGNRKITGGVDTILVLKRARTSTVGRLHVISRDTGDAEHHVKLDYPLWELGEEVGVDNEPKRTTREQEILQVLDMHASKQRPMTATQVWDKLKKSESTMKASTVGPTLSRLASTDKMLVVSVPNVDGRKKGYYLSSPTPELDDE